MGGQRWDVTSEAGFLSCSRATFADVYAYAAMLAGRDRSGAEDVVHDVYLAALARARRGDVSELSVGYLLAAVRSRWVDVWRAGGREQRRLAVREHVGAEVAARRGFEDELAADLSAAWRGDAPALTLAALPRRRRRSAWWIVAAAALAAAVVLVVGCRGESELRPAGPSPAPVSVTEPVLTTSPRSPPTPPTSAAVTSALPTAAASTAPVSATVRQDGFDPACGESTGTVPSGGLEDEAGLDDLGPVGPAPLTTVALPNGWFDGQERSTTAEVQRIPGGILLVVRAPDDGSFDGSMLMAINHDGTVRWVRCSTATAVTVAVGSGPADAALVGLAPLGGDAADGPDWRVLDLATGDMEVRLADVLAGAGIDATPYLTKRLWPLASDEHEVVFGPSDDTTVDVDRDRLLRIDLATMTPSLVPFPAVADGVMMMFHHFRHLGDGALAMLGTADGQPPVLAAYVGDRWSDAPDDVVQFDGIEAAYSFDAGPTAPLEGRDGHGNVVWRQPALVPGFIGEGFRFAPSDDVTVATACLGELDLQAGCSQQGLAGVRTSDGKILWRLPDRTIVAAIGDGYAIVGGPLTDLPDGAIGPSWWTMIDTATGRDVPGQRWDDPAAFRFECCGGQAYVERLGGIVAVVAAGHVALWYPAAFTRERASLTVPERVSP